MVGNIMRFICKINHSLGKEVFMIYLIQRRSDGKVIRHWEIFNHLFKLALVQAKESHCIIKKDIPFLFKRKIVCVFNNAYGRFK